MKYGFFPSKKAKAPVIFVEIQHHEIITLLFCGDPALMTIDEVEETMNRNQLSDKAKNFVTTRKVKGSVSIDDIRHHEQLSYLSVETVI